MHRSYVLGFVVLGLSVLFSPRAMAGGDPPIPRQVWIDISPTGARYIQQSGEFAMLDVEARATYRAGAQDAEIVRTTYHKLPTKIPKSGLGKLGLGALGRLAGRAIPYYGAYLTLKDLADGAGWVQKVAEEGEWPQWFLDDARDQAQLAPQAWCVGSGANRRCSNTTGQLAHAWEIDGMRTNCHVWSGWGGTGGAVYECNMVSTGALNYGGESLQPMPAGGWEQWHNANPAAYPGTPVTDAQMGELVASNPAIINAVLIDPETGKPVMFPELATALNALRRSLEAASTALGETVTPGTDIGETPTDYPADPVVGQGMEWPGFCSWATVVCDFIDWAKEEPDLDTPEMPIEETVLEPSDWSSGIGGGSCPGPIAVDILDGNAEFEFTPLCDAVIFLKPWMLLMAGVAGAFIVAGVRMGKNN